MDIFISIHSAFNNPKIECKINLTFFCYCLKVSYSKNYSNTVNYSDSRNVAIYWTIHKQPQTKIEIIRVCGTLSNFVHVCVHGIVVIHRSLFFVKFLVANFLSKKVAVFALNTLWDCDKKKICRVMTKARLTTPP